LAVHHRYDLLAAIGALRSTLSVSGTHGKTTTSALLTLGLEAAGVHPAFLIGGVVAPFDTGSRWTDGEWLVLEGDESDSTFLAPPRRGCLVTNIEADHLDHHGTFDDLLAAFARFVAETDGPAVLCGDDGATRRLATTTTTAITYGRSPGVDAAITDVIAEPHGTTWTLRWRGESLVVSVPRPGEHLVLNATAALVLAGAVGVDLDAAARGIADYAGVGRRYERRGRSAGVELIDDYAHLPTEVRAVLEAARQSGPRRLVAVFQPHRYSRTADHHADYATAFDAADVVVITDIYPAGEEPIAGVDGRLVFDAVAAADPGRAVHWAPTRADLVAVLAEVLADGDLCLTMGAGDLTTLPDDLLTVLDSRGAADDRG
jgi:UDP-N-acetylmuramate--alanine ligase